MNSAIPSWIAADLSTSISIAHPVPHASPRLRSTASATNRVASTKPKMAPITGTTKKPNHGGTGNQELAPEREPNLPGLSGGKVIPDAGSG